MTEQTRPEEAGPYDTVAAIRAQAKVLRSYSWELESMGLRLSGRPGKATSVEQLVSVITWTTLVSAYLSRVASSWGMGLAAHAEYQLREAGIAPPAGWEPDSGSTAPEVPVSPTPRPAQRRRWWRS